MSKEKEPEDCIAPHRGTLGVQWGTLRIVSANPMQKLTLAIGIIVILLAVTVFSQEPGTERSAVPGQIAWHFTEEQLRLFSPPMDATIVEMREWADRLERPIPNDTEKWGGRQKYRELVALLRIDIAKQIIASKPDDDQIISSAWHMQWFPHLILAKQDKANIPQFENLYAEMKEQNDLRGRKCDIFTVNLMGTRGAVVRDLLDFDKSEKYFALAD